MNYNKKKRQPNSTYVQRTTEEYLNTTKWMQSDGTLIDVSELDKEYLRNILGVIYKKRDSLWLNCANVKVIKKFYSGDVFFRRVVVKSTLWNAILNKLSEERADFNFKWEEN